MELQGENKTEKKLLHGKRGSAKRPTTRGDHWNKLKLTFDMLQLWKLCVHTGQGSSHQNVFGDVFQSLIHTIWWHACIIMHQRQESTRTVILVSLLCVTLARVVSGAHATPGVSAWPWLKGIGLWSKCFMINLKISPPEINIAPCNTHPDWPDSDFGQIQIFNNHGILG